jgi:Uma2 family endonuclease
MSDPVKRRATYQDILDAPEHMVAEILNGELYVSPRPGAPHTAASSALGFLLGPPFQFGNGGPGGWIILDEPELHVGDHVVVPDLAGWRRERMPEVPEGAAFTIAPDWVCEWLSKSTETIDRAEKLPIYADVGVKHVWLASAERRTLEVLRLEQGKWLIVAIHRGDVRVRAEPFEAIEIDLALLWANLPKPRPLRASEPHAEYDY